MSKHWPTAKIGDVLTERRETPSVEDLSLGCVRIISKIGFDTGRIELRTGSETKTGMILARPGDLVISGINAAKGAIASYGTENTEPIAATIHYGAYTPKPGRADLRFLWWFFRSQFFRDLLNEHVPGGIKTELKSKRFLPIPIPLPPLAEQRRVVARIEELAAQIHEALTLRQQAAEEAQALVGAKAAKVFRSAMKNGSAPLESVASLERGKFHHRPRNEPRFFGGDHPWIQIGEIESSNKYVRSWTQTLNNDGLAISKKFPRGTVLISIAATIGSVGILDFDCCVPDSIVGVTPRPQTDSEFLYHYLGYLRGHFEEIAPQSAQKNINLGILTKVPVPKLALAEQRRIVAELDALQGEVDALKRLQAETAAELDALLPSILDKAFKGEL
jgi:type I restriction enzyme S subunit